MNETTPLLNNTLEKKKPSPWYIIIPLFCLTFVYGALYAPLVQFLQVVYCNKYYHTDELDGGELGDCAIPEVQELASEAQAVIMFLTYTSTLLFAGYFGSLSDKKGRRFVLMTSTFGNALGTLAYILTHQFSDFFGVTLLFIGSIIRGSLGGETVLIAAAQAYISDCTTPASRTVAFGHMLSSVFLGATIGPTVGSLILKQTQSVLSIFYMVLTVNLLFIVYIYFILPESNLASHQKTEDEQQQQPTSFLERINIFSALSVLSKTSSSNRFALPLMAAIQFCLTLVAIPPSMLYAMLKFHWTAYEGGIYTSIVSFTRLITTLMLLPMITKLFHRRYSHQKEEDDKEEALTAMENNIETLENMIGVPPSTSTNEEPHQVKEEKKESAILLDTWLIRVGLTFETCGYIAIALASTSSGFLIASVAHSVSLLSAPSVRSLLTLLVGPSEIGQLLGAMSVVESVAMIISQLSMNSIYSASVRVMPELVFYICAVIAGLALILAFLVNPKMKKEDKNIIQLS